jgi:peptidoglycan/LPS O-acetylase OafA/YrhL
MDFILRNFKWLMLLSGVLTSTMFYGLFAPQAALQSMFGSSFNGELESLIIRSWSALVGLMGLMLIFGAFNEKHRVFAATIAALSKLIFVVLLFIYGQSFLQKAAPAIGMDLVVVACTLMFLIAVKSKSSAK